MTEVKMPEPACNVTPYDVNSVYWQAGHEDAYCKSPLYTEAQLKQYGDDRGREALEMAALKFETQHAWLTNALRDSSANLIRALAKEIK